MTKHTFSMFLIKENVAEVEDIFTEQAKQRIDSPQVTISPNPDYAEDAVIYIFQNPSREPKWLPLIASSFDITRAIRNRSSSAVLVFRKAERLFVVTFGYAWLYIDPTVFVADFGLRVALNAADDKKLKRLDIANLGEAIKGVAQSASQRRFETFGVDEALELVRKISGALREEEFGSSVSGSNSLKIRTETNFAEIPELAERALDYFVSDNYKQTSFRVIDNISPELDSARIHALDERAAHSISAGCLDFELGVPEFSEDDISSFGFVGFGGRNSYSDLQLSHYREALGEAADTLNSSDLRKHRVKAEYLNSEKPPRMLKVYDALVGSIELEDARYAINEGQWYKVDAAFKRSVDSSFFDSVCDMDVDVPAIVTRISEDGRKQYLEAEGVYNARYADARNCLLMDRVLFNVPDVARSGIELCDLLDIQQKRLIHVKMSGRKSSVLSHFFKQGANSATLIKSVDALWVDVQQKVRELFGEETAQELSRAINENLSPWTVEFHIANAPLIEERFNIPFFSRVTFRDEQRRLRAMGYEVAVRFIAKPQVTWRGWQKLTACNPSFGAARRRTLKIVLLTTCPHPYSRYPASVWSSMRM